MENAETNGTRTPSLLFHYTSQKGLLGIISQNAIWASSIHYLNDAAEYAYAQALLHEEIKTIQESVSAEDAHFLEKESEYMGSGKGTDVFVSSFSEVGDLLSQWRGYCPAGGGFSIGFDFSFLKEIAEKSRFTFAKCIYDIQEQKRVVRQLLYDTLKVAALARSAGRSPHGVESAALNYFHQGPRIKLDGISELPPSEGFNSIASLLKHPSYLEEKEWRVVQRFWAFKLPTSDPLQFREGKNAVIPYGLFRLPDPEQHAIIRQIIIGPMPYPDLSRDSLIDFLSYHGIRDCSILKSAIP